MNCGPAGVSAKIVRERPFVWAYVAVFKEPIISNSMHAVVINLTGWLVFDLNQDICMSDSKLVSVEKLVPEASATSSHGIQRISQLAKQIDHAKIALTY